MRLNRFLWLGCFLVVSLVLGCTASPPPASNTAAPPSISAVALSPSPEAQVDTATAAASATVAASSTASATATLRPSTQAAAPTTPTDTPTPRPTATRVPTYTASPAPGARFPGQIAYFNANDEDIWLLSLEQASSERIYEDKSSSVWIDIVGGLSWSPDGKKLAFSKIPYADIYILTLGSSEAENIVKSQQNIDMHPDWSPDGKKLVFISDRDAKGSSGAPFAIYSMRVDGSGVKKLFQCTGRCNYPDWSPDGEKILFEMDMDIYIMDASGAKPHPLTSTKMDQYPKFSPDGQWIAFLRLGYIYIMKADGSSPRAVVGPEWDARFITWSPDGQYLAFESFPSGGSWGVYVTDLSGDTIVQVSGLGYNPSWSPVYTPRAQAPTSPAAAADCSNGWSKLTVGGQAKVAGGAADPPNRVRAAPTRSAEQTGSLAPGSVVKLLEGPVCSESLVFWKVEFESLSGWSAEGDGVEYWLIPVTP